MNKKLDANHSYHSFQSIVCILYDLPQTNQKDACLDFQLTNKKFMNKLGPHVMRNK